MRSFQQGFIESLRMNTDPRATAWIDLIDMILQGLLFTIEDNKPVITTPNPNPDCIQYHLSIGEPSSYHITKYKVLEFSAEILNVRSPETTNFYQIHVARTPILDVQEPFGLGYQSYPTREEHVDSAQLSIYTGTSLPTDPDRFIPHSEIYITPYQQSFHDIDNNKAMREIFKEIFAPFLEPADQTAQNK